ncbi:putative holin-like toxin [Sporosarcina koreensis]|uniref:putative holin-like toxin n=1 Tax=Sporosarcina koreensis TaxID=334735 RepID=UPI0039C8C512
MSAWYNVRIISIVFKGGQHPIVVTTFQSIIDGRGCCKVTTVEAIIVMISFSTLIVAVIALVLSQKK